MHLNTNFATPAVVGRQAVGVDVLTPYEDMIFKEKSAALKRRFAELNSITIEDFKNDFDQKKNQRRFTFQLNEANERFTKILLNLYGVCVIKDVVSANDLVPLLMLKHIACLEFDLLKSRQLLRLEDKVKITVPNLAKDWKYKVSTLGNLQMMTVPRALIDDPNQQGSYHACANSIANLEAALKLIVGTDYVLEPDLVYLYSDDPNRTTRQHLHADSVLSTKLLGLLVLTDYPAPTLFLPKENDIYVDKVPATKRDECCVEQADKDMLAETFAALLNPEESVTRLYPVAKELRAGDIVLFESDTIHCADRSVNKKVLGLFPVSIFELYPFFF